MGQVEVGVAQLTGVDGDSIVARLVDAVDIFAAHHYFAQMLCALQGCRVWSVMAVVQMLRRHVCRQQEHGHNNP